MEKYQPSLHWIQQQYPEMYRLLVAWSTINSGSHNLEGQALQLEAIRAAFSKLEGEENVISLPGYQRLQDDGQLTIQPVGQALTIRKRPHCPRQVLLCGHIDTVFDQFHSFQQTKHIDHNTLNGPGVADMKGGLIVMFHALLAFERSPFCAQLGWQVLLTPDEEIGSQSSASLLESIAKQVQCAFVYEPAMTPTGILAGARKGSGKFDVVVHGRAAHAGRDFFQGRNAIVKMAQIIQDIEQLNGNDRGITINVGNIHGGEAVNIVPDLCIAHLDIRYQQKNDAQLIQQQLQGIVNKHHGKDDFHVELYGHITRPVKPLVGKTEDLFQFVKQTGLELGIDLSWKDSGGCCDGNNLAEHGLPVVDSLGVRGGHLHSENEYVLLDSLVERAQLSSLLLMKIAAGEYQL